jgi:N-acetylmuramoyl-L-alanine amidase
MRRRILLCAALFISWGASFAQRTDLSGLKFCIDPGHGGNNPANDRLVNPDPGVDFWESESNFRKALHLKALLEAQGATVILTRLTNTYPNDDEPSLTARWTLANNNNVNWFHSIHSNAAGGTNTSINYTLMLVKENIPTRTAAFPEAVIMSDIMGPAIRAKNRTTTTSTWLDYTFYGGPSGGFNLGVLSGLLMPGELSEGSFHDFYPETRRLLNNDYRKMEAYALRNAFMQYFGVPPDTRGIIAGIETDIAGSKPVNAGVVRLLPSGRVYAGDAFNNGFFMFDSLAAGTYTVRYETPGYRADSVVVVLGAGQTVFADRILETFAAPSVLSSSPVDGDTAFAPTQPIGLNFSKTMDTASVRRAFSITPPVAGALNWFGNNTIAQFKPAVSLPQSVWFTVKIDTMARSAGGQQIDGNKDGTGGDPFVLQFRTRIMDVTPPRVVARAPDSASVASTTGAVINVTFDEPLNPASVIETNFIVAKNGTQPLSRTVTYGEANGRGGVNVYVPAGLVPGTSYLVRLFGVKDMSGNAIPGTAPVSWTFSVSSAANTLTVIDSLDSPVLALSQPVGTAGTTGLDSASVLRSVTSVFPSINGNLAAAVLRYSWNAGAGAWLLRTAPDSASAPKALHWKKTGAILQAYVYGDASGNQIRFAVEDSVEAFPGGGPTHKEVGPWRTIDWVGWRLVEWNMEQEGAGAWVGNGVLEGELRYDGVQLRHVPGAAITGQIVIDHFQLAMLVPTGARPPGNGLPGKYFLGQNYPNPFNPATTVEFTIQNSEPVTLRVYDLLGREVATLVNEIRNPGAYAVQFDAAGLASGVYYYRLTAGGFVETRKMMLIR